ncbi:MAG TPA: glutathione S-transferase family protein [Myxococcota bacterium]|nr:glutathione S-transferase family protein [Myxococcota bacterium]HND34186.1 glutathione S-transferase family protein [Myxococcota bacterium]HNH46593.1 glutathione S-transferase family protein [Myxococcota bacterium]
MIQLYTVPGAWGLSSVSPFCAKLETWLRLAQLRFEVLPASMGSAPKGKVPYIKLEDGTLMGDSQLILEHLTQRYGVQLDDWLSPAQKAQSQVVRRMLEEGTYWCLVHERWNTEAGFAAYTPVFLKMLPPVIGGLILGQIRRDVRGSLKAQGTGRHKPEEIAGILRADVAAVADLLGDRLYFHGDQPSSVDATIYAMLSGLASFPVPGAGSAELAKHPNVVAYLARVRKKAWPEEA